MAICTFAPGIGSTGTLRRPLLCKALCARLRFATPLASYGGGGLLTRASSALTSDSSISACLFSLFIAVLSGAQELIWKVSRRPQHPSTGCRKNCSEALFLCADLITIRKDCALLAQRLSALLIMLSAAPQAHVFIFLHPRRSSPPRTIA